MVNFKLSLKFKFKAIKGYSPKQILSKMERSFLVMLLLVVVTKPSASIGKRQYNLLEDDSRYISHQDLMSSSNRFEDTNITTYSRMLFDVARNQMIVGARDAIFRLSFDLHLLEKSIWEATPSQIQMCQMKGQSEHHCRNYIMVLQSYENQLYACGTYAFSPNCSWRQMENLTVTAYDSGVGKCSFSPNSNITALLTSEGQIFVGSPTDFSGSDAAIMRTNVVHPQEQQSRRRNGGHLIRTKQYNSKWLDNPQFVGSFDVGSFVYFVFRETAAEYMNCGKVVYSRIARVCKSDAGGDQILNDNWTSFLKARLNCSLPGEYPFYFNEIQGMTYSAEEDVLYATFTTPNNGIHGSAVCAFNLSAINAAFDGPFKFQEHIDSNWKDVNTPHRNQFSCKNSGGGLSYKHLLESSRYQLMDEAVQPITVTPLYYSPLERFSNIAIDIVSTKYEGSTHVLYISTEGNLIKKLSVLPSMQTCLIEVWQYEEEHLKSHIHSMEYLKVTDSLYVGTDRALMRINSHHCKRHVSETTCLNAMDPYCGWNELRMECTPPPIDGEKYWKQKELQCPILTAPIDGGWSAWSDWFKCNKHNDEGSCLCRSRNCINPAPKNGGEECVGISTEVTNCTVNGGWTEWSAYSGCSSTCGVAVKTKRRTCGNPKPAFGGRTCVGPDRSEIYCSHLPPCPSPKPQAIDGGWGPWGQWSECSAECGGGFRIRRRECNDPSPQNGGMDCPGCNIDYEVCNAEACPEVKKLSQWTPWLVQLNNNESNGQPTHVEKRFRFVCRATTSDVGSMKINLSKEETRICHADGICQRGNSENEEESVWSEWSPCSVSCGGGLQYKTKNGDGGKHQKNSMSRVCNTQPCPSEWGCWTEWSPCSVTCGVGIRKRTRKCLGPERNSCKGKSNEEEKCEMKSCAYYLGWSNWSDWSACSIDGIRYRTRKCQLNEPNKDECFGDDFEKAECVPDPCNGTTMASFTTITTMVALFALFYIMTIFFTFWITRRRFMMETPKNNSPTPSYDAYPNQYSSLPTKDIYEPRSKPKRQSSFSMSSGSKNCNTSGTLNKSNNIQNNHTPKVLVKTFNDCESGTLKRNSHGLNNYRNNIDDEKF